MFTEVLLIGCKTTPVSRAEEWGLPHAQHFTDEWRALVVSRCEGSARVMRAAYCTGTLSLLNMALAATRASYCKPGDGSRGGFSTRRPPFNPNKIHGKSVVCNHALALCHLYQLRSLFIPSSICSIVSYFFLHTHYLIKSIRTPTRNCNPTFPVTHFPVVDINTGWAHPLPL
jgi:hypothetical protein